ncbi:MAG: hypothetical protein B6226_02460 [Candidatus Cloacimonetes bacterium 4572_65]|nr:MAG: hypothetical protein B6226_02460 [Candidatus Cloacimonetes bacterium 4572_65]
MAVKIDITEKIEMQQNLEQNNVALNSIIDNIPVGVVLVDKNKNIQQANKATADMLHYDSLEELNEVFLGKRCDKDFCKINSDLCPIIHLNEEKVLFAEHELYIKSDIPKKTITVIKSSIPITINNTYYIMEVFVDISERKKNEQKLKEETIRANLMAEEANSANRAKRDFLANMSHEIRTPMNGVIGMSDVLLETNLSEEQRSYAKTVKESANSLLTIINDILDFSKIEAGKLDIENKDFDLSKLLINVATTFAFKTDEKGLELICKMSDSVPQYIVGDEIRIRQIITNLLGNAVKFTQKGEVVLSCKTMIELADSYILKFSIKDTGIGIDENQQVLLFDKFTQADGSITRRFGGTGLGLTISKQLAHLMNGDIGVISTLEKGSTFWFTIEVSKSEIDKKKLPITPLKTLNVLVIDDNETSLSHIGDILKSHSINNCLASSGKIGLDKIEHSLKENTPFDIILIDADMPNMSGEKTELLISQKFPSLTSKKALLTSISNLGQCKQELCDRFDSFIAKPIHKYSLFITLTELHNNTYKRSNVKSYTKRLSTIKISNKGRSKILLVEDNKINQIVAKTILMKLNTDITVAGNGLEAVQLLQKESFDLVFMDIQMPLLGGVDSTKQIRDFNSLVPIIAMTANAMKGDREEYLSAGMNGYIAKPVSIKAIREALESWIPLT